MKYLIFDTESTGLNIRTDTPFLFVYCTLDKDLKEVVPNTQVRSKDKESIKHFIKCLKQCEVIIGSNVKFDMHMSINIGVDIELFKDKKYVDVQVLARLIIPADQQQDNTFSIALKKLGTRYLGIDGSEEERKLKAELAALKALHKENMRQYFIDQGVWDTALSATEQTKRINEVYTKFNKHYHKYPELIQPRKQYMKQYPEPNYSDCPSVEQYAMFDLILTKGLFIKWFAQITRLKQLPTLMRISSATYPVMLKEREGLVVDLKRLLKDRDVILKEMNRTKIIDPRNGQELSIGQHAKLKELYEYESGESLDNADKFTRSLIASKSPSAEIASYKALMERYFTTYITRILDKLVYVDGEFKIFSQFNMAGTITGRFSSDLQQFPKDPLELETGDIINIRAWFIVPKDKKYMFLFDYDQMELRIQCEWTALVNNEPDLNLARAFYPYKCVNNNGKYYLEEDLTQEWRPVDLHSATAKNAFPNVPITDPEWKSYYRMLGKRTNFAVNYGASAPKIQQALNVDMPTAIALVEGYKKAFPGVVAFGKWIQSTVWVQDHIPNILERRYYSRNKHSLLNWLVQGTGADVLLEKIYELYKYIEDKPHWRLFLTVHDEIALYCDDIDWSIIEKEAKEIRALLEFKLNTITLTVGCDYSETNWSEKKEIYGN